MNAVSLSEFASILSVSEPTLRKKLPDAPEGIIIKRGTHGDAYEIDPAAGVKWWLALKAEEDTAARARREQIGAFQLSLLGDDAALSDADVGGISASDQLAALQAELAAIKLGKERGELVRADDVLARQSEFMIKLRDTLIGLPVRLARRVEVPADMLAMLNSLIATDLNALADFAQAMSRDVEGSDANAPSPAAHHHPLPQGG